MNFLNSLRNPGVRGDSAVCLQVSLSTATMEYSVGNVEAAQLVPVMDALKAALIAISSVTIEFERIVREARESSEKLEETIKQIAEHERQIKELAQLIEAAMKESREKFLRALELLEQQANADLSQKCFASISQDKAYASRLLSAARANINNPSRLTIQLKNSPCSSVVVHEIRDSNGLVMIFRIGRLIHCLSTKKQCGGKPYSIAT